MEDQPLKLQVACEHLRHKLMFVAHEHEQIGMVDDSSDTRVFWCSKTQEGLGPDDEPVSPTECHSGRACYCQVGYRPKPDESQVG